MDSLVTSCSFQQPVAACIIDATTFRRNEIGRQPLDGSALEGTRVLDLTHHIAGPYCTKLLADFGADVIKVERPGAGDPARNQGPFVDDDAHPDKGLPFLYLNTSKRSVTLNLKSPAGQRILEELVAESDVVVESFRPTFLPSLGLGYEHLRKENPSLVMVSISSFGQSGPYRDYEATDIVEYALGGILYIFGLNEREPLKHALDQAQYKAGTNAASGAAIAILHRLLTGQGQLVDVSIQESITSAVRDTTSAFANYGIVKWRQPKTTSEMPRGPVETSDGYIMPIAFGGVDWCATADFLNAPELKEDRFATPEGREEHADELQEILSSTFAGWKKFDLFYEAHKQRRLIYGVVQDGKEALNNPQYESRGYFVDIDHPVAGLHTYPGAPFNMSETPWRASSSAPTLGQHNSEIYGNRLGYSKAELARLAAAGVI
ncbi:MAG: CoA transferase [SAR202 cluster bacterium]|nr:CoA transferase [SAR202 cluster bacterium]